MGTICPKVLYINILSNHPDGDFGERVAPYVGAVGCLGCGLTPWFSFLGSLFAARFAAIFLGGVAVSCVRLG